MALAFRLIWSPVAAGREVHIGKADLPKSATTPTVPNLAQVKVSGTLSTLSMYHLAVRALVQLQAIDACLEALDGPYADRALWEMSERIGTLVMTAITDSDQETAAYLKGELARHGR